MIYFMDILFLERDGDPTGLFSIATCAKWHVYKKFIIGLLFVQFVNINNSFTIL